MKKFLKVSIFLLSALLFAVLFLPKLNEKDKKTGGDTADA